MGRMSNALTLTQDQGDYESKKKDTTHGKRSQPENTKMTSLDKHMSQEKKGNEKKGHAEPIHFLQVPARKCND